jgi:hypothetical protein
LAPPWLVPVVVLLLVVVAAPFILSGGALLGLVGRLVDD